MSRIASLAILYISLRFLNGTKSNIILDQLKQICKEYFDRMYTCESQKYDMEFEVRKRGFEVRK